MNMLENLKFPISLVVHGIDSGEVVDFIKDRTDLPIFQHISNSSDLSLINKYSDGIILPYDIY
jgi:heptaprenylglyceryl phosphate synthase